MLPRETLVRVLRDQQEGVPPPLVRRDISIPTRPPLRRAVSVVGPRRAGKTYSMFQLMRDLMSAGVARERLLYLDLEDYRLAGADQRDLGRIIDLHAEIYPEASRGERWIFLDEVQAILGWEGVVRTLLDLGRSWVFVTGSSSRLLSREVATQLRGRTLTFELFPFSFREFLRARGAGDLVNAAAGASSSEEARLKSLLREYLSRGGYPEAALNPGLGERILREIWEVTVSRDLIDRWGIRNVRALRLLVGAVRRSREFSVHGFYRYLKSMGLRVGKDTLYNYLEYLRDAMIVFPLRRYSRSVREIEATSPKLYLVDNGLYLGEVGEGELMENLAFLELRRRGAVEGERLFYWRSRSGSGEVDFLIADSRLRPTRLVQVTREVRWDDPRQVRRELGSLVRAARETGCRSLWVVTWDQEGAEVFEGAEVELVPMWRWALGFPSGFWEGVSPRFPAGAHPPGE